MSQSFARFDSVSVSNPLIVPSAPQLGTLESQYPSCLELGDKGANCGECCLIRYSVTAGPVGDGVLTNPAVEGMRCEPLILSCS